ncbi:MAG: phosphoribosyltransferase family protein [Thermoleophilia bacterium]
MREGVVTGFRDRADAGRAVAAALAGARLEDPLVLGLARGGVPVAAEVAASLHAPLDVLVVRKIGHPEQPEYALGAVTADGTRYLRDRVPGVDAVADRAAADAAAMEVRLRDGRPPLPVAGRDVVLVDDGLATGATMVAAARSVRRAGCRRVVVAVPVGPEDTLRALRREADEVVCALVPRDLVAVSRWFDDFHQVSDDEVRRLVAPG